MAIKLVLTDIDGTIMPYGKRQVTQRCRAAFHAAMDAGILVGPASGSFFSWIPSFFGGDKACCQTALATNGMQVYLEGRKVLQMELPPAALRTIMGALQDVPRSGLLVFEGARPLLVQGSRDDLAIAFPSYAKTCEDADALRCRMASHQGKRLPGGGPRAYPRGGGRPRRADRRGRP